MTIAAGVWRYGLAAALLALTPAAGRVAFAFHEGGVAHCNGCHVTHTDGGGATVADGLLNAESASDVCLSCHADAQGRVLGSNPLAPPPEVGAGNFVFLLEDDLDDTPGGGSVPITGDAAGHNVVAPGHLLGADPRYAQAPGGTFPSGRLGCTSCHDPHGNAEFRMLYGMGDVQQGVATFSYAAPDAVGIGLGSSESPSQHTAYRSGMSDWCANCHGQYHQLGISAFQHEVDMPLSGPYAQRYNDYDGDSDPSGGVQATAYLPDVPFESAAATTSSTAGPNPSDRLMCLSCHRAHASSGPAAGRWDFNVAVLADDGVESVSYAIPSPYPTDPAQGPLCAKCHATAVSLSLPLPLPDSGPFAEPPSWPTGSDGP